MVAFAPDGQFLSLTLGSGIEIERLKREPSGHAIFFPNHRGLALHICANSEIGRLAVIVIPIIHNIYWNVADPTSRANQPHYVFVVAAILEFLVAIAA